MCVFRANEVRLRGDNYKTLVKTRPAAVEDKDRKALGHQVGHVLRGHITEGFESQQRKLLAENYWTPGIGIDKGSFWTC